jgi:hypothetical protein
MSFEILPALSSQIDNAQRIVETLVLRTNGGTVFTIEIGEPLTGASSLGAKVTQVSNPSRHLGICIGETIEQVFTAAQELIATAIAEGLAGSSVAAA